MLSGDNSILQKATDAKENSEKAQIEERIKLAYHSSLVNGKGIVTEPSLESELKNEFNKTTLDEGWLDKTSVEGKWKITIDGVYLEVPAGSISTDSNSILGFGSVNDEYKIQFGHIVTGYGIEGTWRLFYADSNNVYLIRDSIGSSALNSFSWFGTSTISTLGENLNKKYTSWELKTNGTDLNNDDAISEVIDNLLYDPTPSEYQGEIGERLELEVHIDKVIPLDGFYGKSSMHIMSDENENVYVWTTASRTLKEDSFLNIRGTVKDHRTYHNCKQTILTRCKVVEG